MNIVVMCRGGNVRSVAAKQILSRYLGHEVIAIGADNTNETTKKLVFDWADKIIVMAPEFLKYLEIVVGVNTAGKKLGFFYKNKSILLNVGNDIWGDPFNEDLQTKIVIELNSKSPNYYFEITKGKSINLQSVLKRIREYKEKIAARNKSDEAI